MVPKLSWPSENPPCAESQYNKKALLGDILATDDGRFPLMIRLLDINENLPPAIHPTIEYAKNKKGRILH